MYVRWVSLREYFSTFPICFSSDVCEIVAKELNLQKVPKGFLDPQEYTFRFETNDFDDQKKLKTFIDCTLVDYMNKYCEDHYYYYWTEIGCEMDDEVGCMRRME
jgi:hypothetical protein